MAGFTTRLGLRKPGGGSSGLYDPDEVVDIDVINDNMDKIDANIGIVVVTSTTRPSAPYLNQIIEETDTGLFVRWNGTTWVEIERSPASFRHAEFRTLTGLTDTALRYPIDWTLDAARSSNAGFATPFKDQGGTGINFPAGISLGPIGLYAINFSMRLPAAVTARSFMSILPQGFPDGTVVARSDMVAGEDQLSVSVPNLRTIALDTKINLEVFKTNASPNPNTFRVEITRLG